MRKKKMMNNKHYIKSLVMLATMLLVACGSGSDGIEDTPPTTSSEAPKEIRVNTNLTKMQTRATIYDNTNLQSENLLINAYYHGTNTKYLSNDQLHYDASAWKFWNGEAQLHYYWPIEGSVYTSASITVSSLDFVGYCPYTNDETSYPSNPATSYITTSPTYDYSAGTISFTSSMPTTTIDETACMTSTSQASFKEFMYAIANEQTYARQEVSGGVPLTFKHPFACVMFSLSSATTKNVIVNEISINDLVTSGSCIFNGTTSTWSSQSGNATMMLTEVLQRGSAKDATAPFLVIPNNYGATKKTLTVKITWREWDEEKNMTFTTPLDINWAAGYSYTYSLTITKDDLKVDIAKFTEQW